MRPSFTRSENWLHKIPVSSCVSLPSLAVFSSCYVLLLMCSDYGWRVLFCNSTSRFLVSSTMLESLAMGASYFCTIPDFLVDVRVLPWELHRLWGFNFSRGHSAVPLHNLYNAVRHFLWSRPFCLQKIFISTQLLSKEIDWTFMFISVLIWHSSNRTNVYCTLNVPNIALFLFSIISLVGCTGICCKVSLLDHAYQHYCCTQFFTDWSKSDAGVG